MTLPFSTVSASRPCFSSSALVAEDASRRQPLRAGTSASSSLRDGLEVVDGRDHLGRDAVRLGDLPQQHLQQFDRRAAAPPLRRSRSMLGRVLGSRARPRCDRRRRCRRPPWTGPCRAARRAVRRAPRASCGAASAISISASSLRMRERGTSRLCASSSRQAATSISTARSRGLRTRDAEPLPGVLGMLLVGRRASSRRSHLVGEPGRAARLLRACALQRAVDVAQMGDVGDRVGRPARRVSGRRAQSVKRDDLSIVTLQMSARVRHRRPGRRSRTPSRRPACRTAAPG